MGVGWRLDVGDGCRRTVVAATYGSGDTEEPNRVRNRAAGTQAEHEACGSDGGGLRWWRRRCSAAVRDGGALPMLLCGGGGSVVLWLVAEKDREIERAKQGKARGWG